MHKTSQKCAPDLEHSSEVHSGLLTEEMLYHLYSEWFWCCFGEMHTSEILIHDLGAFGWKYEKTLQMPSPIYSV